MKYIIGLVAMLLPLLSGAQSLPIKPLNIGDTVPDIALEKVINYKDSAVTLSSFKGKYIILDFWAAWCGACISELPKLDSLQAKYTNKLQIIMVNCMRRSHDNERKIRDLVIDNWQQVHHKKFNCLVVADSSDRFRQIFSFKTIPHYVWINSKGIIVAITASDEVNEKNISSMLKRAKLLLPLKQDIKNTNSN